MTLLVSFISRARKPSPENTNEQEHCMMYLFQVFSCTLLLNFLSNHRFFSDRKKTIAWHNILIVQFIYPKCFGILLIFLFLFCYLRRKCLFCLFIFENNVFGTKRKNIGQKGKKVLLPIPDRTGKCFELIFGFLSSEIDLQLYLKV